MVKFPKLVAESDEMPHLDSLRFIAAMGIVVYHYKAHVGLQGASTSMDGLRLFVDLFFVISGFVIARLYSEMRTRQEYLHFLQKRVARLWPLHVATALASAGVGVLVM